LEVEGMLTWKLEVNAPVSVMWDVLWDITRYMEFQKDLKKIEVIKSTENVKTVRHEVEILKPVFYILDYIVDEKMKKLSWKLVDCSTVKLPLMKEFKFMEKDEGWWELIENGPDKCSAIYNLEIAFNSKIPSSVTNMLAKKQMPTMMAGYKKQAESIFKKG